MSSSNLYFPSVLLLFFCQSYSVIQKHPTCNCFIYIYMHISNCFFYLCSPKLSDLVQLEPDLPQKIEAQYGLSIEGYTEDSSSLVFDGASENSTAVQSQLQDKLQNICSTSLPVRPYPLLQAGRKDCLNRQIPVLLTERGKRIGFSVLFRITLTGSQGYFYSPSLTLILLTYQIMMKSV